jgi:outer membrane protein OmpA-like peptidoglycan-associated protein
MPETRLRPDLWAHAESLKQNEHFSCAAAPTAQFEVQMLQAIHEDRIGGWRRTSPYIAIAESLSARAQEALDNCIASAKVQAVPVAITTPAPMDSAPVPAPVPPVAIVANRPVVAVAPPSVSPATDAPKPEKPKALVILSERVFFAFGSADISDSGRARMREVASILNTPDVRDRMIFIDGYTDDVGNSSANQLLSERRADAVRRALIDNGIDPTRLTSRGFGDARPVVANHRSDGTDDPEARAQNRRVELVLEPQ